MLRGNYFRKESGCRNDSSTLVGRMKGNVEPVRRRKAQKKTAQNGLRSERRSRKFSESGSKKPKHQKKSGSGKEVSSSTSQVEAHGTGVIFSMIKWESEKRKSWGM